MIAAIWALTSCRSNENTVITHYQQYPQHFDELVNVAYKDPILLNQKNKLVGYDKLDDRTKEALKKLDLSQIQYVSLGGIQCQKTSQIEIEIFFGRNWHLQYVPCREGEFTTGEYSEVGFVETWQISKDWYVWVNNDFIG